MSGQFDTLGLSDRVVEALEAAEIAGIRELARYTKQELIDLPGIGATSAERILAALDIWFVKAIAADNEPNVPPVMPIDLEHDPIFLELLAACAWAEKVLQNLGGQRGMFLCGQMRMRVQAVQNKLPTLAPEPLVTEVVKIG